MHTQAFKLFLWFAVVSIDAIVLGRRMAPIAMALAAAFVATSLWPGWAFHITSIVNLITTLTFAVIWWPKADDSPAAGSPDDKWNDSNLADIATITGSDFEAVETGEAIHPYP